ncbi:MAG: hypothetical protein DHS20C18_38560 [Saprospiraceae bacterium]|nr:MAG: hypothetical protein DHS20C18_38560 [Saprospiraceae bacterium]
MIQYYSLNGEFNAPDQTNLQVSDLSILRGYALFDFFRVINSIPLFLEDYLDRFFRSAELLHLSPPLSRPELQQHIFELINKNGLPNAAIRLVLTGGYAADAYTPIQPNLLVMEHPFTPPPKHFYLEGATLLTYLHEREFPLVKSTNYLTGISVQKLLKARQVDFVLYHDGQYISESDRSNFGVTQAQKKRGPKPSF